MKPLRVLIVMGVCGSGKSTVGQLLAARFGAEFHDADDWQPEANVRKMAAGIPLDDADRAPWLERMRRELIDPAERLTVLACSALRRAYREALGVDGERVRLVYLRGSRELLQARLEAREGHFMKSVMLASQLETLEEPDEAGTVVVEIGESPEWIVDEIGRVMGFTG